MEDKAKFPNLDAAFVQAAKEAALYLTYQVQYEASANGWGDAASTLSVGYSDNQLTVKVPDDASEIVKDLEFGTEDSRPTAVIRNLDNRTAEAEEIFTTRFLKIAGIA